MPSSRALLAVAALVLGACETTAPTATPGASAASSARPTPTPVPIVSAPPASALPSPDQPPDGPRIELRSADGRFTTTVVVEDGVGIVTGIADATPLFGRLVEGIAPAPDGVNGFIFGWLGGACDTTTTISLGTEPGGGIVLGRTTANPPGPCILIGVPRAVLLQTSAPVDPRTIAVR